MTDLVISPVAGLPEVHPGDDLAEQIVRALGPEGVRQHDIIVIAHKVVAKAEGRLIAAADRRSAALDEATRVLRRAGDMIIAETRHGFVCANAGVDASNVADNHVALLPLDPDLSARRLRKRIAHLTGVEVAIIVSDTFGRAWRLGQTNVAIGIAGIEPFIDYRGTMDSYGRTLSATRIAVADELAGAAELVMGKTERICAAVIRGARVAWGSGAAVDLVRPSGEDLFR